MGIADDLRALLSSEQVSTNRSVLEQHSRDESYHTPVLPDVVVYPRSTEDVVQVVRYASVRGIPVVPFGVGSGLEGHVVPVKRGISLDMMQMQRILEIRPKDFLVRVQPGVTRKRLNDQLRRYGLFFSVDPGADASLGGMTATNASGTTAVRYGTMKDNVRALTVVLASGEVIRTGSFAAKSSSGYNLTPLFVGSEGTLGIFTEITLRLFGIPEATVAGRAEFADIQHCGNAAVALITAGIPITRVELVDAPFIEAVNAFKQTHYAEVPTLFLEFSGSRESVEADSRMAQEILSDEGCRDLQFESDEHARNQLWEARHSSAYAFQHQHPGCGLLSTDVCVPLSELPGAITNAKRLIDEMKIPGAIVGHVGDGNFHVSVAVDPADADALRRIEQFNEQLVFHALRVGGTCTGEHGVGLGKRKYQEAEHGSSIQMMRGIKEFLDPGHILNPGKLIDEG
ncbi:FAD-binding protein [Alicyclobacillus cycloheptanicus]|uniref:D-lactate dehydrogenase (cytochrome) n=1 Tax=Alicyclobacillus cycloheptanicus TaxID=1457 RepID=A0ABT9XGS8_9BACL|nr:FAD-linked oxidase C-terminal domain-containing protein [Alicyclobacillus cycloheptanicus]MDQ0189507.1 D-lactate dehydrogenase (cytochrome) [Alicyclobacillus cycloheptanicus]WDM01569.1 FAD-binding protein [Alicyclobacillus cycloheptanicus]